MRKEAPPSLVGQVTLNTKGMRGEGKPVRGRKLAPAAKKKGTKSKVKGTVVTSKRKVSSTKAAQK